MDSIKKIDLGSKFNINILLKNVNYFLILILIFFYQFRVINILGKLNLKRILLFPQIN